MIPVPEPSLQELLSEGFERVTQWQLQGERIRMASLEWAESSGWLYAFVVDESLVKYVGLTNRVLRSRMDNYRDGKVDQNRRLRELIAKTLSEGRWVAIYGRREPEPRRLVEEEIRLRDAWRPEWNRI